MKNVVRIFVFLEILMICRLANSQAPSYSSPPQYDTRLVGELMATELRLERGVESFASVGLLGLGHYYGEFGFRIQLMRYTELISGSTTYPSARPFVEWFPIRISYVPFFLRGKYTRGWSSMENEPFFIWKSVTPGEYAKMYVRLFAETSYIIVRGIRKKYPFVLTTGTQFSYGLLSFEGGFKFQPEKWYEFVRPGNFIITKPFSFTGPYISANVTIGGILTRSTPRKL